MNTTELKKLLGKDDCLQVDTLSLRSGVFAAKRSYFYGVTESGEKFANHVKSTLEKADTSIKVEVVDYGNHFHSFVGGAKSGSSKDSYHWVKFKVTVARSSNDEEDLTCLDMSH